MCISYPSHYRNIKLKISNQPPIEHILLGVDSDTRTWSVRLLIFTDSPQTSSSLTRRQTSFCLDVQIVTFFTVRMHVGSYRISI